MYWLWEPRNSSNRPYSRLEVSCGSQTKTPSPTCHKSEKMQPLRLLDNLHRGHTTRGGEELRKGFIQVQHGHLVFASFRRVPTIKMPLLVEFGMQIGLSLWAWPPKVLWNAFMPWKLLLQV